MYKTEMLEPLCQFCPQILCIYPDPKQQVSAEAPLSPIRSSPTRSASCASPEVPRGNVQEQERVLVPVPVLERVLVGTGSCTRTGTGSCTEVPRGNVQVPPRNANSMSLRGRALRIRLRPSTRTRSSVAWPGPSNPASTKQEA
jgi:hypothetical protein